MQYWGCSFVSLNLKITVLAFILTIVRTTEDKDAPSIAIYSSRTYVKRCDLLACLCSFVTYYRGENRVTLQHRKDTNSIYYGGRYLLIQSLVCNCSGAKKDKIIILL